MTAKTLNAISVQTEIGKIALGYFLDRGEEVSPRVKGKVALISLHAN